MNISKALKVKNRLVGALKALELQAKTGNSIKEGQTRSIRLDKVWEDIEKTRSELIILKGKIALATSAITPKLAELAERKNEISFYEGISINEGSTRDYEGDKVVSIKLINFITEADKNDAVKKIQKVIDDLQDEIDEYNASTSV